MDRPPEGGFWRAFFDYLAIVAHVVWYALVGVASIAIVIDFIINHGHLFASVTQ